MTATAISHGLQSGHQSAMELVLGLTSGRKLSSHRLTQMMPWLLRELVAAASGLERSVVRDGVGVCSWNSEVERGSDAWDRLYPHFSSIGFDNLLGQGEADASAGNVFTMQAVENLKNGVLVFGLNTDSVIADREHPGIPTRSSPKHEFPG